MKIKSPVGRTAGQKAYCRSINEKQITICQGPAGTGKTYIAAGMAAWMLSIGKIDNIKLCRPVVDCGKSIGFLPGTSDQKVGPYVRPLFDELSNFFDMKEIDAMMSKDIIEIVPLNMMRGRTFNHSFVIMDEAQNAERDEFKMFTTRLGNDSKMVICGDASQSDLPIRDFDWAINALRHISKIGFVFLTKSDIVRHPLVGEMIDAYEAAELNECVNDNTKA